jgi:YYY domain-containing protein
MPSDLLAFFKWYLAITFLGAAAWPLAFKFLRRLPDRGYTLVRTLGLLLASYVFWMAGSLGLMQSDAPAVALSALLVGGVGLVALGRSGLAELGAWLKAHWRVAAAVEVVFVGAFALMAVARAYNPQLDGTERPMELMFINSILRSPTFPPQDAWLAGNPISYYYFGYVMIAALIRLTGVVTEVAFNLGLAMLFALAAVGALGLVLNLVALVKQQAQKGGAQQPASAFLQAAFAPALAAPLLVLVVGNFYGVASLLNANGIFADLKVPVVRYYFGTNDPANTGPSALDPSQAPALKDQPGIYAGWTNIWDWLDLKAADEPARPAVPGKPFSWDLGNWFFAARVVKDRNLTYSDPNTEAIDEMPAFSFILGDMHPHVLGLPIVMLCLALALEWLLWAAAFTPEGLHPADPRMPAAARRWGRARLELYAARALERLELYACWLKPLAGRLGLSALIVGALFFLNTWDFPIYIFMAGMALVIGLWLNWGWATLARHWAFVALVVALTAVLGVLLYWPYVLTAQSQVQGLLPNIIYPTRFQQTFVMFGPVLIGVTLFVGWLTLRHCGSISRAAAWWAGGGVTVLLVLAAVAMTVGAAFNQAMRDFVLQFIGPLQIGQAIELTVERRLIDNLATLFPAVIIGLTFGLGWGALRKEAGPGAKPADEQPEASSPKPKAADRSAELRNPAVLMVLLMMLTGALLLLAPEWVYVHDLFGDRMNTMFKFYFQAWILWALAVAFGLWYLTQLGGRAARWVMNSLMGLAVVGGLLYTLPGLSFKADHFAGPPTLDGMAWFAQAHPNDWAAIQWLRQNVPDAPVIAEGAHGEYFTNGTYSRISMSTGLPTVLGWLGHEEQWRGASYDPLLHERDRYLCGLYQHSNWATTEAILDHFNVEYVLVSPLETSRYTPVQVHKFDQNMRRVFQAGDVSIYQRLPGSSAASSKALPDPATLCPNLSP